MPRIRKGQLRRLRVFHYVAREGRYAGERHAVIDVRRDHDQPEAEEGDQIPEDHFLNGMAPKRGERKPEQAGQGDQGGLFGRHSPAQRKAHQEKPPIWMVPEKKRCPESQKQPCAGQGFAEEALAVRPHGSAEGVKQRGEDGHPRRERQAAHNQIEQRGRAGDHHRVQQHRGLETAGP